ncbi:MAG: FtsQ-type POTRA domain-containing protein [Acidobacteriota bacterium]
MSDDPRQRPSTVLGPVRPTGGQVLPFRRRAVKPKRKKRSLALSLWRPFSLAVLLVGLPVATGSWALSSPHFALRETVVEGTAQVTDGWIEQSLEPLVGRNLLTLSLAEVDTALSRHPWIAGLEVSKELPHRLVVAVVERQPVAVIEREGEDWLADASGEPIEALAGRAAARLPRVSGGGDAVPRALEVLAELEASEPRWAEGVTAVEVLSDGGARLHTESLPFPLLVRAGQIAPKAGRLASLVGEIELRYPGLVALDLRYAERIVLRPAGNEA